MNQNQDQSSTNEVFESIEQGLNEAIEHTKGKNFSGTNTKKRNPKDFYQTPYSMTAQLLQKINYSIPRNSTVLDPADGAGAVTKVLRTYLTDTKVIGTDINKGDDFLQRPETDKVDWIITNPPYSLANEFIEKSFSIAREGFAMLLPLNYLQSETRYNQFFKDYAPAEVYVFTRMPWLSDTVREDGKYQTAMLAYCWMVWVNGIADNGWYNPGLTALRWISNQEYILKKRDA